MLPSKQLFLVLCALVWLAVNLVIWSPLRGVIESWTSVNLNHIVSTAPSEPSTPTVTVTVTAASISTSTSTVTVTAASSSTSTAVVTTATDTTDSTDTDTTGDSLYPQFMLFGDSITEQSVAELVPRLAKYYSRRLDVINRGFGGYTSADGLEILPSFFPATFPSPITLVPQVRLMTVFFGANDAGLADVKSHVPLAEYEANLRKIFHYEGIRLHATKVIFITPPPVYEHKLEDGNESHTVENTAQYAAACCRVAASLGRPCLNLWNVMMTKAGWTGKSHEEEKLIGSLEREPSPVLDELLVDGLHLSPKGYQLLWRELKHLIEAELPSEVPSSQPMVHPIPPALLDLIMASPPDNDKDGFLELNDE